MTFKERTFISKQERFKQLSKKANLSLPQSEQQLKYIYNVVVSKTNNEINGYNIHFTAHYNGRKICHPKDDEWRHFVAA